MDDLGGLPGPFIKYFEHQLGQDAYFQLSVGPDAPATVACTVAFYDGTTIVTAVGIVKGTVVPARGSNGFGFDVCFMPNGQTKTYAEMTPAEKDQVSHRALTIRELAEKLHKLI